MKNQPIILITFFLFLTTSLCAQDFRQIESLKGNWKFSVGDNKEWAKPDFDDSDWDQIRVPSTWENQGYDDYNGFAWYRKTFEIDGLDVDYPVYLLLGRIDDADEVYLDGQLILKTGQFPPNFITGFNQLRSYRFNENFLKEGVTYTIAIRVYDDHQKGGIEGNKIGFYYDYDLNYIDFPLSGNWKFKTGKNKEWTKSNMSDDNWDEINVPGTWEDQGYREYDGYAYYRKSFVYTANTRNEDLYLVLGKVDDQEYVYLNGESIGSYKTARNDFSYRRYDDMWRNMRYYKIPKGLLKNGQNQITVQVYDGQGLGGIYAGPVGITSEDNYEKLKRKYYRDRNFLEVLIESFID